MINAVDGTGRLRSAMTAMPPGLIQRFEVLKPFIDNSKHLPRGRTAHRNQMAQSREKHSCDAQGHPTHSALKGDRTHPTADVHKLVDPFKGAFHDHHARCFRGYIAILSNGHPDRSSHHRRRVIDTVAYVKCLRFGRLLTNDVEFFFGILLGTDLGDTDLFGKVAKLRFAISGDDHDASEMVLWPQVLYKGTTVRARRIAKAKGGGVAMIH